MRLALDRTIKTSDILTSVTILLSVVALLVSWSKDRDIRTREQADGVRAAAAKVIVKLERWQMLQLSLYSELQPAFVEVSENLAKQFDVVAARDLLWKRINALRVKVASRVLDEGIETAYVDLFVHLPSIRENFQKVLLALRGEEEEAAKNLLARTEAAILAFEGKRAGYQTAQLGNALRAAALAVETEFRRKTDGALAGVQKDLYNIVTLSDDQLLTRRDSRKND